MERPALNAGDGRTASYHSVGQECGVAKKLLVGHGEDVERVWRGW